MQTGQSAQIIAYGHTCLDDVGVGQQVGQGFPKGNMRQLKMKDAVLPAKLQQRGITALSPGKHGARFRVKSQNLFLPQQIERAIQFLFRPDQADLTAVCPDRQQVDLFLVERTRGIRPGFNLNLIGQPITFRLVSRSSFPVPGTPAGRSPHR